MLRFATGGVGAIVVAWTSTDLPGSYWIEVTASRAALRLDLDPAFRLTGTGNGAPVAATSRVEPFVRSLDRFITAVRTWEPESVFCAPADAMRTLAVASAAEEALVSGQAVEVTGAHRRRIPGPEI